MNKIDVSIIVTTRNEEKHIAVCLDSIKRQNYPQNRQEIIVVDNNSTDRTKEIAARFTDRVYNYGPERSAQRNFGISKSKGKYFLYLDADMILSENLISECVRKCESDNLVALYIPERVIGKGFWIKVRDFERGFYNATCIDAVRFVRKEAASSIKGFDEILNGPEDWDFDRRIKAIGKVGSIKACLFHDEGEFRFSRYLRKKRYYTTGFSPYIAKWGKSDEVIKRQLGGYYRLVRVFLEHGKWKKLLRHPALALGMYILRIGVGLTCRIKVQKNPGF